jgi:hypothetical protein
MKTGRGILYVTGAITIFFGAILCVAAAMNQASVIVSFLILIAGVAMVYIGSKTNN